MLHIYEFTMNFACKLNIDKIVNNEYKVLCWSVCSSLLEPSGIPRTNYQANLPDDRTGMNMGEPPDAAATTDRLNEWQYEATGPESTKATLIERLNVA